MSGVFVRGAGAVSPAGWGLGALRAALAGGTALPDKELLRPGWEKPLRARPVPAFPSRPAFLGHARFRRVSPISHYAVAAALEALGEDSPNAGHLGIIMCVMSGCVNYSRRFYEETLRDPATASPLIFPETVFNAPSSHLASLLGATGLNYTLVGDPGTFLQGLALAAEWLSHEDLRGCLVVGAEEIDWLTADAHRLFARDAILSDGAGAVYLSKQAGAGGARLHEITDSHLFHDRRSQITAALRMRSQLGSDSTDLLCDSRTGVARLDRAETKAWGSWPGGRISLKAIVGEGLMAAAAWQAVVAADSIRQGRCASALVSVVGCNQQAIGARFTVNA
jgi:3-oxoacyl-(acyl-carrier-protein) synthase